MAAIPLDSTVAAAGPEGSGSSTDYLIFHYEKVGVRNVLGLLAGRSPITDFGFVECSPRVTGEALKESVGKGRFRTSLLVIVLVFILQKFLSLISAPLRWAGLAIEFLLNLLSLNGGILGTLWRSITCSLTYPHRSKANFRSIVAHIDGRMDLYSDAPTSTTTCSCRLPRPSSFPGASPQPEWGSDGGRDGCSRELLDLTMMASKVAYENEAYIRNVVSDHWKMHFVEFFSCWNKYQSKRSTQAFIFCDKMVDAQLICVAFRGTELFNALDWSTDVELSWISMGKDVGRVHLGFMKALGLQDEKDFATGFPKEQPPVATPDKPLAYYAVRETLRSLIDVHPKAKVLITGHSLGGALASLFPALLVYHGESELVGRIRRVVTHAQPRVGDKTFASYMKSMAGLNYARTVYRFDIVPRVPFDLADFHLSSYRHFGTCVYYRGWTTAQVVEEMPNKNYFNPLYLASKYGHAVGDLVMALFIGWSKGKDFSEGWVSIFFRVFGLVFPGAASHSPRDYVNAARLSGLCLLHHRSVASSMEVDQV